MEPTIVEDEEPTEPPFFGSRMEDHRAQCCTKDGEPAISMVMNFPVMVCLVGAVSSFWATARLRKFKVGDKPPASCAHLSLEERQNKIRIASWIAFGLGCIYIVAAIVFWWLTQKAGGSSH